MASSVELAIASALVDLTALDANKLARLTIALDRLHRLASRDQSQACTRPFDAGEREAMRDAIASKIAKLRKARFASEPEAVRAELRAALQDISAHITRDRDAARKRHERAVKEQRLAAVRSRKRRSMQAEPLPAPPKVPPQKQQQQPAPTTPAEVQARIIAATSSRSLSK